MAEERRITIATENGTSFAVGVNDYHFSTLFSMYDNSSIPDRVILSGATGEIVDEEIGAMFTMLNRTKTLIDEGHISLRILTMLNLHRGIEHEDALVRTRLDDALDSMEPVYFHEIARLSLVMDLSDVDLLGLLVDERTLQVDRMNYYKRVGSALYGMGSMAFVRLYTLEDVVAMVTRVTSSMHQDLIRANSTNTPLDELHADMAYSLIGLAYNTMMRVRNEGRTRVKAGEHPWEDILTAIESYLPVEGRDEESLNLIRIYAGKGDVSLDLRLLPYSLSEANISLDGRAFIIESILRRLPEDVDPDTIGLHEVIKTATTLADDMSIISRVRRWISRDINTTYCNGGVMPLGRLRRSTNASELIGRLSPYVVGRIRLSLLAYSDRVGGDKNAKGLADAIGRALIETAPSSMDTRYKVYRR